VACAGLACAGVLRVLRVKPAILDAGEAFAIEVDGALGTCAIAQYFCVEDCDREEDHESKEEPPRREGVAMERKPSRYEGCGDDEEANISEAKVRLLMAHNLHLASLLALFVFL
jgi:hypothetical protein